MGLTKASTGKGAVDCFSPDGEKSAGIRIALAGNPNVGKSTVFNGLTGMHQHTGNWPGKTVTGARGNYTYRGGTYTLVDLPGCYSLMAHSAEEEVARDFICFGDAEAVVVVCDATCLERNLNLVLQIIEITSKTVVCVNLMDEAKKKKISIRANQLECLLGVPVVCTAVKMGSERNYGYTELLERVRQTIKQPKRCSMPVRYGEDLERAAGMIAETLTVLCGEKINPRWLALRLLAGDTQAVRSAEKALNADIGEIAKDALTCAYADLEAQEIARETISDRLTSAIVQRAEKVARSVVKTENESYHERDRKIDRVLTGKCGFLVMALLFLGVFWLTIVGSNYPSGWLSSFFFQTEGWIYQGLLSMGCPAIFGEIFVFGVYRMVTRVVSVMLPPMAIFFPLFTLLEDAGYLPRVAFNLDKCFQKCSACGKQALTMCIEKFKMFYLYNL